MPVTVTGQTVSKLRDAILSGVFKPGERLLEQNLCDWMGVSRTSVREALRRLEAERLITITPNRGPSVTEITWDEARSIYEVRALLEGEAVALFAERASPAQLSEMKLALADFDRAVSMNAPLDRLAATERFYSVILSGCGNRVIGEIIQGLVARINFLRARSMSREGRSRQSTVEMWRIFDAIEKRNPTEARAAAVDHVHSAAEAAHEAFDSDDNSKNEPVAKPRGRRSTKAQDMAK
ncbi:MAG: GntR family transcriptional regulator [Bradyrhizobiaceae bacterium]|nr:GntR family transcriptional regulator [Bradyrhizobiaceae bacterium]